MISTTIVQSYKGNNLATKPNLSCPALVTCSWAWQNGQKGFSPDGMVYFNIPSVILLVDFSWLGFFGFLLVSYGFPDENNENCSLALDFFCQPPFACSHTAAEISGTSGTV